MRIHQRSRQRRRNLQLRYWRLKREIVLIGDRGRAWAVRQPDKSRSILNIECDNYDPETGKQRQLCCLGIASKRYALFLHDDYGNPVLLQKGINNHEDRWSEHGLGHLRNPLNPQSEDRDWIPQAWISIIRRTLSLPAQLLGFEHLLAIGRVPITSPTAMRSLTKLNRGKECPIKPFDLLLSCHVKQFGYTPDVDSEKFHLVAQTPAEKSGRPKFCLY
jgi:hypothetical protein